MLRSPKKTKDIRRQFVIINNLVESASFVASETEKLFTTICASSMDALLGGEVWVCSSGVAGLSASPLSCFATFRPGVVLCAPCMYLVSGACESIGSLGIHPGNRSRSSFQPHRFLLVTMMCWQGSSAVAAQHWEMEQLVRRTYQAQVNTVDVVLRRHSAKDDGLGGTHVSCELEGQLTARPVRLTCRGSGPIVSPTFAGSQ